MRKELILMSKPDSAQPRVAMLTLNRETVQRLAGGEADKDAEDKNPTNGCPTVLKHTKCFCTVTCF